MNYCDCERRQDIGDWLNANGLVGSAVEVGCMGGGFTREVLAKWKGTRYFMVDPWTRQDSNVYREKTDEVDYEACYKVCEAMAAKDDRIRLIRAMSADASVLVEDNSLDFVYIDANHAYPQVLQDMDLWWPKVKSGGLFSGHDYGNDTEWPHWCEVKKAVDRWMAERNLTFTVGKCSSWWCVKP